MTLTVAFTDIGPDTADATDLVRIATDLVRIAPDRSTVYRPADLTRAYDHHTTGPATHPISTTTTATTPLTPGDNR